MSKFRTNQAIDIIKGLSDNIYYNLDQSKACKLIDKLESLEYEDTKYKDMFRDLISKVNHFLEVTLAEETRQIETLLDDIRGEFPELDRGEHSLK